MADTYTATGTLIDGRTVTLNRDIPIPKGKVRVVVKSLEEISNVLCMMCFQIFIKNKMSVVTYLQHASK